MGIDMAFMHSSLLQIKAVFNDMYTMEDETLILAFYYGAFIMIYWCLEYACFRCYIIDYSAFEKTSFFGAWTQNELSLTFSEWTCLHNLKS